MKKYIMSLLMLLSFMFIQIDMVFAHKKQEDKKGILLVTFGSSYPETRLAFENIDKIVKAEFPEVEIRWAYTSKMIRKIIRKRGGQVDSPAEALAKMGEDGFTHVAVQSLHIIPGEEYDNLKITVDAFDGMPKGIKVAKLGTPLLFLDRDHTQLAKILHQQFQNHIGSKTAVLFMGHGSHHQSNIYYPGFEYYLKQHSDQYFMGTVEGFPLLDAIIPQLKKKGIRKVVLTPFMSVAGDHARNDMAGNEEDSWKSQLEKEGFTTEIVMTGLAEYDDAVKIWVEHLNEVYHEIQK
ncbi:sirohydrochlorin cobaltochelatase [Marinifilum caeruleilacunae]|uniref:Sirohydrochlorin cobaltochelatase n=1 Tax=Marinifilum caeruleilacunae TaxID=2499076 RepID=A0ABX1WYE2_9BACT|nr:sirohydrochlorin cobaltochelatase [Marinifilum caeruleilacunae]NOU61132.1 sirohydrochlorin cobaltochelatase [Marinifilum caeruleilacunae]